jgi:hypothetical protein
MPFAEKYPRESDVIIKTTARTLVILVRKGTAPLAPKIDWLDPPNIVPRSSPFPG